MKTNQVIPTNDIIAATPTIIAISKQQNSLLFRMQCKYLIRRVRNVSKAEMMILIPIIIDLIAKDPQSNKLTKDIVVQAIDIYEKNYAQLKAIEAGCFALFATCK